MAAMISASGCGGSKEDSQSGEEAVPATTTASQPAAPLEGAGTKPVFGPMQRVATALLQRVAVARHAGYDRVVFEFTGTSDRKRM
jgi:hypothetical protein